VSQQSMELAVWLGIALLALIWANLHLRRVRHVLNPSQRDVDRPAGGLAPSADEISPV